MTLISKSHKLFDDDGISEGEEENEKINEFKAKYDEKEFFQKKRRLEEAEEDTEHNYPQHKKRFGDGKNLTKQKAYGAPPERKRISGNEAVAEGEKPDWKKVKQERKELKIKRKLSEGGNNETYDMGMKAKKIWEELRSEKCPIEKKQNLSEELWKLIKGKTKSLIYAHDTVRVIETLLKVRDQIRDELFHELRGDLLQLAKNKYSRFFVLKLLRCGTPEQKTAVMDAMKGHIVTLMRHKVACDVVELAYNDYANAKQRSSMIQEFFGPRFKLFKEDISTLAQAIENNPNLKQNILSDVQKSIEPILDKGVFTNSIIHTLLKEYMYVCGEPEKRHIIESIREGLLPIIHTRDGARVAMLCLWNGTSKDRKIILKSFKSKFVQMACEEHGHMVLMAAIDCVDDTVFLTKAAISELMANINELVGDESGKKVLRYLVAPRSKVFFHPDILKVLQQGDGNPHSKKERTLKYKEIQKYVAVPILKLISDNIKTWVRDSHWTLFIGAALQTLSDETIIPVFRFIAEVCAEPFIPGEETHFLEIAYMSKMISYLIQCDKDRFQQSLTLFSPYLMEAAETEMRGWILTNRGCFIFVKLFETEVPEIVANVTKVCRPLKSKLCSLNFKGAEILLKKFYK